MASAKGRTARKRYMAALPGQIMPVLRGAARSGAKVIAEEAKDRCVSSEVRNGIKVNTSADDNRAVARVRVKGKGAYKAPWLEYGTSKHFISVDDSQRGGLGIRKINDEVKAGSLVIAGQFVGKTVEHPGARPHPFMRPALDAKESEAIKSAQTYIDKRVRRSGIQNDDSGGEQ